MLVQNNQKVREEEKIADVTSNYFTNITTHLKLKPTKVNSQSESGKYNKYRPGRFHRIRGICGIRGKS